MIKSIFGFLFILFCLGSQAQQKLEPIIIESSPAKQKINTGKLAAVGALIWSENFESTGNTFPLNGITTASKDAIDKGFQRGDSSFSNKGQAFKVPNHTNFAFTNDDDCNCNKFQDELILPSITFNGTDGAIMRFSAYFNRTLSSESAMVYMDSASTWIQIGEIASNQNWKDYEIIISGGTIVNPSFKFVYSDDSSWASGLAIDDIEFFKPISALDLRLDSVLVNNQIATDFYKRIPKSQASGFSLETKVKVSNISKMTAPNAFITTRLTGQNKTREQYFLVNFAPLSSKQGTTFSKFSLANGIGDYQFTSYTNSDSIDSDPSNDTSSFGIRVTDTIYSRINQAKPNRGFWYGPNIDFGLLSLFEISAIDTATSISIYLHEDTHVGDSIDVIIFSEFLQDVVKDSFPQINEKIVLKQEHIGNWVTFKIPHSALEPGKYYVGLRTRGEKVVIGVSDNPVQEKLVYANIGTGFGTVDYLPFVTLNLKGTNCPPLTISPTITNSSCGGINGQITLSVSGGKPAYKYQWGKSGSYSNLSAINGIGSGVYQVTVSDSLGCSSIASIGLSDSTNVIVKVDSIRNERCFGDSSGYIQIGISNGVKPYSIEWGNGSTDTLRAKLTTGNYRFTITDASGSGCNSIETIDILGPYDSLSMVSLVENNFCFSDQIGLIKTKTFGGYGSYNYAWSHSSKKSTVVDSLKTGKYQVTISDDNLCQIIDSFEVKGADSLGLSGVVYDTSGTASIIVDVTGGSPSYTYRWEGGEGPDTTGFVNPGTKDLENLILRGKYILIVTDSLGCTAVDTFLVAGNVSVESLQSKRRVLAFPNPSRGTVQLKFEEGEPINLLVIDEVGREVQSVKNYQGQKIQLEEGLYFFRLDENGEYINTIKIIVIR